MNPVWRPLLEGALQERAFTAIDRIVSALDEQTVSDPTLAMGAAGVAIFYGQLAICRPGRGHDARALDHLDRAIDALTDAGLPPSLLTGAVGVAWAAEHLQRELLRDGGDDPNEAVDELLLEVLDSPWSGAFDLMSGLAGIGVYAIERWPRPAASELLRRLVRRLAERAERTPVGLVWRTTAELLGSPRVVEEFPGGYFDPGVAHGNAGVIAFLAQAARAGTAEARPLLEASVAWLRALAVEQGPRFPRVQLPEPGRVTSNDRSSWCHNDPGLACAFLVAGQSAAQTDWERAALEWGRRSAHRPPQAAGVKDAPLCHGAAGLGHLFNRLYQSSHDPSLRDAGLAWFERTIEMGADGVDGLRALQTGDEGEHLVPQPGLLYGLAGIGLALLAASSDVEPSWDRVLALSARPIAQAASTP